MLCLTKKNYTEIRTLFYLQKKTFLKSLALNILNFFTYQNEIKIRIIVLTKFRKQNCKSSNKVVKTTSQPYK